MVQEITKSLTAQFKELTWLGVVEPAVTQNCVASVTNKLGWAVLAASKLLDTQKRKTQCSENSPKLTCYITLRHIPL